MRARASVMLQRCEALTQRLVDVAEEDPSVVLKLINLCNTMIKIAHIKDAGSMA